MSAALIARESHQTGTALLDQYTPAHLAVGMFAGALGIDPHKAAMAFIALKIVGAAVREGLGHSIFGREEGQSLGNELADVGFETLGVFVGAKLRQAALQEGAPPTAGLGSSADRMQAAYDWLRWKFQDQPGVLSIEPANGVLHVQVTGIAAGVIPADVMGVPVALTVVASTGQGVGAYYSNRLVQAIR